MTEDISRQLLEIPIRCFRAYIMGDFVNWKTWRSLLFHKIESQFVVKAPATNQEKVSYG